MARLRVGINGFGRIGRIVFRAGYDKVDFVGINNLGGDGAAHAHLLKYDSTHGIFKGDVHGEGNTITVDGKAIPMSAEADPAKIPWKDWGVDVVLECTGAFKKKSDFLKHIDAGAKRVLVSAPADESDQTFVYGINHKIYDPAKHLVVSNASCTTNCLAPLAYVLHNELGIERGLMTTIHSYTNDQRILDTYHKDLRRARSAALSMIPTTTGAAKAVGLVLPELKGKVDGISIRVPTPNVSLVDFVAEVKKKVTAEEVNNILIKASDGSFKGVIACERAPLVSSDFNGNPNSTIIDMPSTAVMGDNMVKVLAWYDNEVGFSNRMIDMALFIAEKGL